MTYAAFCTRQPWQASATESRTAERANDCHWLARADFHLLAEASEIEHMLMCSNLYAAFSLKRGTSSGFSNTKSKAVERWRKTIMSVAVEEMGHLLIVANLTAALGGRPHLTQPNFPVSPGYFPSGVVLRLTPFSFETFDHLIFLERPTGVDSKMEMAFPAWNKERTSSPHCPR